MRNKIGVIGAGLVGATAAFALSQSGLASEIVLIDANAQRARGEALDIEHGAALAPPVLVRDGDYPDLAEAHLVIIAAGANQKSGETRLDLAQKNLAVIDSIVPQVARYAPECVLLVVSNPVDVLTWRAAELAGFAEGRVLGSGTVLDTARLRTLLSRHTRVDPRNVHAYVLGEHGDSEVPAWSLTSIAGMNMEEYCRDCKGCGGHLAERMREPSLTRKCAARRIPSSRARARRIMAWPRPSAASWKPFCAMSAPSSPCPSPSTGRTAWQAPALAYPASSARKAWSGFCP